MGKTQFYKMIITRFLYNFTVKNLRTRGKFSSALTANGISSAIRYSHGN